jgi:hypothetical protein
MNRTDFQQLADLRIAEAGALLRRRPPMPDGAYYLAGYAVECALKACIAKSVGLHDFPDKQLANDSHTHNVAALLRVAGLDENLADDADANIELKQNWAIVKKWSERSRYDRHSVEAAKELFFAITDPTDGVLTWIKARW